MAAASETLTLDMTIFPNNPSTLWNPSSFLRRARRAEAERITLLMMGTLACLFLLIGFSALGDHMVNLTGTGGMVAADDEAGFFEGTL